MKNIGIIREGKIPVDHRVPFSPKQCKQIQEKFPGVKIYVQESNIRAFKDDEYASLGVEVVSDVSHCDTLFGVKEVPLEALIPEKTYFFFSHTIKAQPYNKPLMQEVLKKKIKLIDYETLKRADGQRVVAFGRFAGIVGAYNALWTYGQKTGKYSIKRAHQCFDLNELFSELDKVMLPAIKLVLTGTGRVGMGAVEVLKRAGIRNVSVSDYLENSYKQAVYAQLETSDYVKRIDQKPFSWDHFINFPQEYRENFAQYLPVSDIFIAGAYWDPNSPVLFRQEDVSAPYFNISVIADITCDIEGSIPTTIRPATIADPVYDIDRISIKELPPFSSGKTLSVMAVDNLPCEVPRDASESFGQQLIENVLPEFLSEEKSDLIQAATLTESGSLTEPYQYLSEYAKQIDNK